jgi:hypothetical protein
MYGSDRGLCALADIDFTCKETLGSSTVVSVVKMYSRIGWGVVE